MRGVPRCLTWAREMADRALKIRFAADEADDDREAAGGSFVARKRHAAAARCWPHPIDRLVDAFDSMESTEQIPRLLPTPNSEKACTASSRVVAR